MAVKKKSMEMGMKEGMWKGEGGMDMFGHKEGTMRTLKILGLLAIGVFATAANYGYIPGVHFGFDKIWPLVFIYVAAKKIYWSGHGNCCC